MTLAPSLSATLGNLRYDSQAAVLSVCLDVLPRGSSATVTLPAAVRFEAAPGDDASLDVDGGEGSETVLKGKLRSVRRTIDRIHATIGDSASELAAYRPSATLEGQDAAAVVRKLASDAGVQTGDIDVDLDLAVYVAHPWRTAAEHIASLATLGGNIAFTDGEGRLNLKKRPEGRPSSALKFGREIAAYEVREAQPVNPQRFAIGFGPSGSGGAPDALRPTTDFLPSSASSGGAGVRRYPDPRIRVPSAATTASTALQTRAAAESKQLVAHCFLLAALRPGNLIEVQSLPDGLSGGPWLVTRVEHRLSGASGATTFTAQTGDTGSLLGSLFGAMGGLL
jgi:hypothetical protein